MTSDQISVRKENIYIRNSSTNKRIVLAGGPCCNFCEMWRVHTTRYSVIFQKIPSRVWVVQNNPSSIRVVGSRWTLLMKMMIMRTRITRQKTGKWHASYSDGVVFSSLFLLPDLVPGLRCLIVLKHLQTSKPSVLTGVFHTIPQFCRFSNYQLHRSQKFSGLY